MIEIRNRTTGAVLHRIEGDTLNGVNFNNASLSGTIGPFPPLSSGDAHMPAESPTQQLLDRAMAGDSEARAKLIDRACRRLETLTRRMLRGFPQVQR